MNGSAGLRCPKAKRFLFLGLILVFMGAAVGQAASSNRLLVFAAASTTNAVGEDCRLFSNGGNQAVPSFASSSTLAKQIANGAPADIYISANPKWMNYLESLDLIEPGSRIDLLGNRLVLIAPLSSGVSVQVEPGFPLAGLLGDRRLAMGDPGHVPVGIYGKQALESLGIWKDVEQKVAGCKDVRSALTLVERGEAPLGIVYATDAAISKKVRVVGMFPEGSHPAITYPAAVIKGRKTGLTDRFMGFLASGDAAVIFQKYGFTVK